MDTQVLQKMARANPIISCLLPTLRKMLPRENINEEIASNIYNMCVGLNQRNRAKKGKLLEKCIEDVLIESKIPYLSQAAVDTSGVIHASKGRRKGVHIHDFIINASFGDTIENKTILSCKSSLRERWRQDANLQCAKMYMITLDTCSKHTIESLKENNIELVVVGGTSLQTCIEELHKNVSKD